MFLPSYRSAYIYTIYMYNKTVKKRVSKTRTKLSSECIWSDDSTCNVEVWGSATTSHGKALADLQKIHTHKNVFFFSSCLLQKIYNGSGWETDVMSPHDDVVSRSDRIIKTYSFHFEACFFYNYLEWIVSDDIPFIFKWNIRV